MADKRFIDFKINAKDEDATVDRARNEFADTDGVIVDFFDTKRVLLAPSASAVDVFPTGAGTLALGDLEVTVTAEFNASGVKYFQLNPDAVGNLEFRDLAGLGIDTSLTATNPDTTYSVILDFTFYKKQ